MPRRPTPLDPYPEPRPPERRSGRPPRDLGPDAIAILEGRTFMVSDAVGDVPPDSVGGLVHEDTRFVSRWELTLGDRPLSLLKSAQTDYDSAEFFVTNGELPGLRANTVALRRLRFVGSGALEQLSVFNTGSDLIRFELRLACGADFADLFEIKDGARDRTPGTVVRAGAGGCSLRFRYQVPGFVAETTIDVVTDRVTAQAPARVDGSDIVWEAALPPRCLLTALLKVGLRVNRVTFEPSQAGVGERIGAHSGPLTGWLEGMPRLESDSGGLESVFRHLLSIRR